MPEVTFLPMNHVVDVALGETLLEIALREELPIQHACGGFCACTTCHVWVRAGEKQLSSPTEDELDRLDIVSSEEGIARLACQAKVQGDVTVEIVNLDE